MPDSNPAYLNTAEAAQALGYSVQHVRRLLREGELDGFKQGRDWILPRDALVRFQASRQNLELDFGDGR